MYITYALLHALLHHVMLLLSHKGMARMCCDTRKSVRQTAITYLQRALLAHELQSLTTSEWEACFLQVYIPLVITVITAHSVNSFAHKVI